MQTYNLELKEMIKQAKKDILNTWLDIIAYQQDEKLFFTLQMSVNEKLLNSERKQTVYTCDLHSVESQRLPNYCSLSFSITNSFYHLLPKIDKIEFIASLNDDHRLKEGYKTKNLNGYIGNDLVLYLHSITNNF